MSTEPDQQDGAEQPKAPWPPDGRGPRPTDPVELAKWIMEQTTGDDDESPSTSEG